MEIFVADTIMRIPTKPQIKEVTNNKSSNFRKKGPN